MTLAQNANTMRQAFSWSNTVTIFATQPGQVAFERGGEPSVGYFADTLTDGLMGEAANKEGEITVGTLMDYLPDEVDSRVKRDSPNHSQRPQLLTDTGRKIVLAYTGKPRQPTPVPTGITKGPGGGEGAKERPSLRLRLPSQALTSAHLTVTRNFFTLKREELVGSISVDPGEHFLEVKYPGYEEWAKEVDVQSPTSVDVLLRPDRRPVLASLAVVGAGAGAIAAGLAFGSHARTLASAVNASCSPTSPCEYKGSLREKDEAGRQAQSLSRIFLVAGSLVAVAGAGAAGYFYWSRPALAPEAASITLAPTPDGVQLSFGRPW